jgi:hypothetical protein
MSFEILIPAFYPRGFGCQAYLQEIFPATIVAFPIMQPPGVKQRVKNLL